MNVPKEVILDLLPVYLAGEASPATKALVEEYLAQNADLAQRIRRQREDIFGTALAPSAPPELELRALHRTRRLIAIMHWIFGFAIAFTAITFSTQVSYPPVSVRLLLLDRPAQFLPCLVIGVGLWIVYFTIRRRLRVAGV